MSAHTFPRPVIKPSHMLGADKGHAALEFTYFSGPESKKNILIIKYDEYIEIINRIFNNKNLIDSIISAWREYATLLRECGEEVEPSVGGYYESFMKACDPNDAARAAMIAALFREKIESDVLFKYITDRNPSWATEFSVQ